MSQDGDEIQDVEAEEILQSVEHGIDHEALSQKPQPRAERVPSVRTRHPGKVNRILEGIAQMFKGNNPTMDCRWVYHPEHKKELSNVIARKYEGYQHVEMSDLGEDAADLVDGDEVRVGDVVLMKISLIERGELFDELNTRAREQSESVEGNFYEDQKGVHVTGPDGQTHEARARGHTRIEEREFTIDREQRTSEEGR